MQREGILRLLSKLPSLLALSVEGRLRPAMSTLTDMGLSRADIARKVVQQPHLLYSKPERYREILGIMQGHGITIQVPPSSPPLYHQCATLTLICKHCSGDPSCLCIG